MNEDDEDINQILVYGQGGKTNYLRQSKMKPDRRLRDYIKDANDTTETI